MLPMILCPSSPKQETKWITATTNYNNRKQTKQCEWAILHGHSQKQHHETKMNVWYCQFTDLVLQTNKKYENTNNWVTVVNL